ncbi:hypothetical protein EV424DRAFT_520685 [Suillus variegatus]|nr:hypothetical protein EV424DRAFT_520685 [Suillus variegatus]
MVWCSSEHRRFMFVMLRAMWLNALRALHSTFSVCTQLRLGSTKFDASVLWNGYSRFPVLLLLLAHFAAGCGSLDTSHHLFLVIPIPMPTASFAFLIWCIVKAHGIGPIVHQPSILHGSKLG